MRVDQINTPADLCRKVLACVRLPNPRTIADFAAGSGELLKAALDCWGPAMLIALDIDARIVRNLRRQHPCWIVSQGDFLNQKWTKQNAALRCADHGIDLILLNPPFSSRGGSRCQIPVGDELLSCSRAVAFVILSLRFLNLNGELVAIIPAGSLTSEKDRQAWQLLRETFDVAVMGTNGHKTFDGCFPQTVIVRISARRQCVAPTVVRKHRELPIEGAPRLVLYRGSLQMHELRNGGGATEVPLVHSTCLRNGSVDFAQFRASNARFTIKGPALLLVRVGEPRQEKIVLYTGRNVFALSDCVIALKAQKEELKKLYQQLIASWSSLLKLYRGTGARYITVARISNLLRSRGFVVDVPPQGSGLQLTRAISIQTSDINIELRRQWRLFLRKANESETSN
ncbi:MAG TPA: hypothetical protein VHA33_09135 [Candidatus Angelobacter sp.]|jgi:hypothetical protein|nr:hypothetical protein [Candidatus Angelobacter sp.]